jgi:hypothetical protein
MDGGLDALLGFRRRFLVTPLPGRASAALEDDIHCMAVTLHHDGVLVTRVEAEMERWPWTTCPGAIDVLRATFEGAALAEAAARGMKQANCTHLYDLAVLAASHAGESAPTRYEIVVSDPVDGLVTAEIRRDGNAVHRIVHRDDTVLEPAELARVSLFKMRGWIESLSGLQQEAARLLQWGTILAHGRTIPLVQQSDAGRIPPNCYTFQPENKVHAKRFGRIIDFSRAAAEPLDHFGRNGFEPRPPAAPTTP